MAGFVFNCYPRWDLSENPSLPVVLRLLGEDGWEMDSVSTTAPTIQADPFQLLYVLKRPAPTAAPSGQEG